jgi:hypothetical protein
VNRKFISILAAAAVMLSSSVASAQSPAPKAAQQSVGPTVSASAVGVRAPAVVQNANARAADAHMGAGENVALMVVGGAALIIGAIMGHTAGALIAVAGAVVGLYGLYHFIQ